MDKADVATVWSGANKAKSTGSGVKAQGFGQVDSDLGLSDM